MSNGLKSYQIKIWPNVVESMDMKVGGRADVGNMLIKLEMID